MTGRAMEKNKAEKTGWWQTGWGTVLSVSISVVASWIPYKS